MLRSFRKSPEQGSAEYYNLIFTHIEAKNFDTIDQLAGLDSPEKEEQFWQELTEKFLTKRDLTDGALFLSKKSSYKAYFIHCYGSCFITNKLLKQRLSQQSFNYMSVAYSLKFAFNNNLELAVEDILNRANDYQLLYESSKSSIFSRKKADLEAEESWHWKLLIRFLEHDHTFEFTSIGTNARTVPRIIVAKDYIKSLDILYQQAEKYPELQKRFLVYNDFNLVNRAIFCHLPELLYWWWEKAEAFSDLQMQLVKQHSFAIVKVRGKNISGSNIFIRKIIAVGNLKMLRWLLNKLDERTLFEIFKNRILNTAALFGEFEILMWLWEKHLELGIKKSIIDGIINSQLIYNRLTIEAFINYSDKLVIIEPLLSQVPMLTKILASRFLDNNNISMAIKYIFTVAEVKKHSQVPKNLYSDLYAFLMGPMRYLVRNHRYSELISLWERLEIYRPHSVETNSLIYGLFISEAEKTALTSKPERLREIEPLLRHSPKLILELANRLSSEGKNNLASRYFIMAAQLSGEENVVSTIYKPIRSMTVTALDEDPMRYEETFLVNMLGIEKKEVKEMVETKGMEFVFSTFLQTIRYSFEVSSNSYSHIPDTVVKLHSKPIHDGKYVNYFQKVPMEVVEQIGVFAQKSGKTIANENKSDSAHVSCNKECLPTTPSVK